MMAKMQLNQVIAVTNGLKDRSKKRQTEAYKKLQKEALLQGISRTYRPKDDDDTDLFPPERKQVQFTVVAALEQTEAALTDLFDMVATLDVANCDAKADVAVNGTVILPGVPVTHLLFLEKQLIDLRTQIGKLPTLDPAETWTWNENAGAYATEQHETTKSKKVRKVEELSPATKEHPAQVQVFTEDQLVGYWEVINFSGAIPGAKKVELVDRVDALLDAVKCAREKANSTEVEQQKFAKSIFGYLLAPIKKG